MPLPLAGKLAPHDYLFQGMEHLRNEIDTRLDQEAPLANLDADENSYE